MYNILKFTFQSNMTDPAKRSVDHDIQNLEKESLGFFKNDIFQQESCPTGLSNCNGTVLRVTEVNRGRHDSEDE